VNDSGTVVVGAAVVDVDEVATLVGTVDAGSVVEVSTSGGLVVSPVVDTHAVRRSKPATPTRRPRIVISTRRRLVKRSSAQTPMTRSDQQITSDSAHI